MKPLIELKNAKKIYTMGQTEVRALDGINLKINKNEFISIIGPSGLENQRYWMSCAV